MDVHRRSQIDDIRPVIPHAVQVGRSRTGCSQKGDCRFPSRKQPTWKAACATPPFVTVTIRGFSPVTAQLLAMPESCTVWSPSGRPGTVSVAVGPIDRSGPPSTLAAYPSGSGLIPPAGSRDEDRADRRATDDIEPDFDRVASHRRGPGILPRRAVRRDPGQAHSVVACRDRGEPDRSVTANRPARLCVERGQVTVRIETLTARCGGDLDAAAGAATIQLERRLGLCSTADTDGPRVRPGRTQLGGDATERKIVISGREIGDPTTAFGPSARPASPSTLRV